MLQSEKHSLSVLSGIVSRQSRNMELSGFVPSSARNVELSGLGWDDGSGDWNDQGDGGDGGGGDGGGDGGGGDGGGDGGGGYGDENYGSPDDYQGYSSGDTAQGSSSTNFDFTKFVNGTVNDFAKNGKINISSMKDVAAAGVSALATGVGIALSATGIGAVVGVALAALIKVLPIRAATRKYSQEEAVQFAEGYATRIRNGLKSALDPASYKFLSSQIFDYGYNVIIGSTDWSSDARLREAVNMRAWQNQDGSASDDDRIWAGIRQVLYWITVNCDSARPEELLKFVRFYLAQLLAPLITEAKLKTGFLDAYIKNTGGGGGGGGNGGGGGGGGNNPPNTGGGGNNPPNTASLGILPVIVLGGVALSVLLGRKRS